MATRLFMNNTPNLSSSDVTKYNRNKHIYTANKLAVYKSNQPGNSLKYETIRYDTTGCFKSAPSYEDMLNLTRGFAQCYIPTQAFDFSFNSQFDNIAMDYTTTNLSNKNIITDNPGLTIQDTTTSKYSNIINKYAQKTDRQFTFPRKFTVLPNGFL
tara:strand:- start:100 stop:567 length:468 start_codon:yes stop_codon:yes gene_type:complete